MAKIVDLPTFSDPRGSLTVLEKVLPFEIKRMYWIYGVPKDSIRGGHGHRKTIQASVCISGSCSVSVYDQGGNKTDFILNNPKRCLILEPNDWHTMQEFSSDALLLTVASTEYNKEDYFYEKPVKK